MRFRDWVTALCGLAAVAVSVFAVGGVLRWSQALVAVLVAAAMAFTIVSRRGLGRVSPLVALLAIAAGLTGLQLIPLPAGLLSRLSPVASGLRDDGAALVKVDASSTLTTDVPATLGALIFFLALLGLAIVVLRIATSERGRYRVIASVAAICGLTALCVGIHQLLGMRTLYGIYDPHYAQPIMLGPLLDTNALACLMSAGVSLGIGLAAHRRQRGWVRVMWLLVVAGCGAVAVGTVSRGGSIAGLAGALVTAAMLVGQRLLSTDGSKKRRVRFVTNALPIGVIAGCMVLLVILLNAGNVERQLSQLSTDELSQSRSKFVAWRSAATLVEESPWLGVGRGAFESAFTRVHPVTGVARYAFLENEYIQAVVDWGIPGALALGCAAVWLAWMALRRWRDGPVTAGAIGALLVVAIQSNVDFGLEFLGLAAPAVAIAATVAYVPLRELERPLLARAARVMLVVALVGGALLLLSDRTKLLDEDQAELHAHPSWAGVQASVERHPLDYLGYAIAADGLDRGPRAIRLLNHAMLLHPTHPDLHRMAARMLYRDDFIAQAAGEYAAALRSTPAPKKLVAEILARFPREQAAAALPVDYAEPELLVRTMSDLGRGDVATLWLENVLKQRPRDSRACERLAVLAEQGVVAAAEVAGKRCSELILDYQTRLALAQILAKQQRYDDVIRLLADVEGWQSRADDKINAWLIVCDAHLALGHTDDAKRCLRRLDASPDMRIERRNEVLNRIDAMQKPAPEKPADAVAPADASP